MISRRSVWKRDGSVTTLTGLTGQSSYLVRCSGTAADMTAVLCHELAHWKRRDHLTSLFTEVRSFTAT